MPLISVNAEGSEVVPVEPGAPLAERIANALASAAPDMPVVLMIHGFRFAPEFPFSNPHTHILALEPSQNCWKAISWPRHLGFGRSADEGLAIGFGWRANGTIWAAYREAARAGVALAGLIGQIQDIVPGRRVDVVAHSLGARVLLSALPLLAAGSVGRVILMAGAEFQSLAEAAIRTPAGATAEFLNITTRENDLFDLALEALVAALRPGDRALGQGLAAPAPHWLDVQVDQAETLEALMRLGHRIAPPHRRVCHWSAYLRPGLFALYRALLTGPQSLPLNQLRAHLPPVSEPRWSRLFAPAPVAMALPLAGKVSS